MAIVPLVIFYRLSIVTIYAVPLTEAVWPQFAMQIFGGAVSTPIWAEFEVVWGSELVQCLKKTVQNCFCHNFDKFPPTLIIFGTLIAQEINLCEVHLFSTSPNLRQRPAVLHADVPNCYITL